VISARQRHPGGHWSAFTPNCKHGRRTRVIPGGARYLSAECEDLFSEYPYAAAAVSAAEILESAGSEGGSYNPGPTGCCLRGSEW